jgi:predicted membrane chloride channel (bestrophin family)
MIVYSSDYFGLLTLLNLNGSAAYRAFLPALFSTMTLVVYKFAWGEGQMGSTLGLTVHPYVITIYVLAFSLVLNFRLNYSYQRYWEAASQLFLMTSKWVDAAAVLASFHYQADIYRPYRPRPFGKTEEKEGVDKQETEDDTSTKGNDERKQQDDRDDSQVRRRRTVSVDNSLWERSDEANNSENREADFKSAKTPISSGSRPRPVDATSPEENFLNRLFGWGGGGGHQNPVAISSTTSTNAISSTANNLLERPTFHRRIPSVDLPRPGEPMLKSFQPTTGRNWEKSAKIARLSHMPRNNPSLNRERSADKTFDVDSCLLGHTSTTQSTSKKHHPESRQKGNATDSPRRKSLPVKRRNARHDSEINILDTIHSNGVTSDRDYHISTAQSSASSHSSSGRRKPRRSSGLMASLNPYKWMGSRTRSAGSLGSLGNLGSSDSILADVEEDDAETSSSHSASTEQVELLPSLFLQEAAHLFSLMSAVAMASLRADLEGCASPLVEYVPGQPFPPVNPDEMKAKVWVNADDGERDEIMEANDKDTKTLNERVDSDRNVFGWPTRQPSTSLPSRKNHKAWIRNNSVRNAVYFLLGLSRSPRQRTLYNASRPFTVMGGLSDNEVELLQKARGPEAQMALCTLWLKEFISREHLDGSTGQVAPPIVARVYQFISDGFSQYNQCRKTAYIQFPFVHSQLTTFFLFISIFVFPYLYYTYVNNIVVACLLNFATMACFDGMEEVAREMQDPFYQFPNDLPLNNYQAHFNEALISCLYGGFHPDAAGKGKRKSN